MTERTYQSGTGNTDIPHEACITRALSPYLLEEYANESPPYSLETRTGKFVGSYRPTCRVFS